MGIRTKIKSKNFFITSSNAMTNNLPNKTTVSSSLFEEMSKSFADGEHLTDDALREPQGAVLYMMQEMKDDIEELHTQVSSSQYSPSDNSELQATTGSFTILNLGGTGVTSTAAELNIMDGNTVASNITPADTDRVVYNDDGTMKQITLTKLATYFDDEITNMPNLATINTNLTFDGSTLAVNGRNKFGTTGGTSNTSHQFYGQSGDTNFFLISDSDGEEVMKGQGSVGGGNLIYTFGDNAGAGNANVLVVDEGNSKAYYDNDAHTGKFGINTSTPTKPLQVTGQISSSGGFIGGATQNTGSYDFPGAIVGYNIQGLNVTHASYNLTTTMAVPDAGMNVCFVAPKSGIVEIEVQVLADGGSSGIADLTLGLSDNATYNTLGVYYEQGVLGFPRFDHMNVTHKWVVSGLTAGTTYKYWLGAKSTNTTGTPQLRWGGSSTGRFSDFIMKATALPSNTEIET